MFGFGSDGDDAVIGFFIVLIVIAAIAGAMIWGLLALKVPGLFVALIMISLAVITGSWIRFRLRHYGPPPT